MKLVRKDGDKANRCPAWSKPGLGHLYPWERNLPKCPAGSSGYYDDMEKRGDFKSGWAIHTCTKCGTKTLPYYWNKVDPIMTYEIIVYKIKMWWRYRK